MALQSDSNEYNTWLFCLRLHSYSHMNYTASIYITQSKEHVHILNELHITIQIYRPPIAITTAGKRVNGGVEQPHAQWIISNPKTKPVHIILQVTNNRYSYHLICISIYILYSHLTQRVSTLASNYAKYIKISQISNILHTR